ncbi:AzlC family ABC transporter permease [Yoonia vestfoldensis]|jgi:predicted branched-subunit amino acid permease|uniref:Inner membrane protein YgaZ n=1 Tax=Yoonia vestfoldensis TaxID=245188 RepID=A0A1Y0EFG5_9RHOB|nr:AzlC family ABC transporter permease [Yoonia vestfoldensis]ARU02168.1 inner membrane protein YgaZ [Yoonia vestfoldensis]
MTSSTVKSPAPSAYWAGLRDGSPFVLMAVPFATLFGVVATDAGLTVGQAMGFTVLVIAGAAQFAAVQMMMEDAGIAFVLLAALAVNLRMAMYSASLVPYLGAAPLWQRALVAYLNFDQTYITSVARYEARPDMRMQDRVLYFLGVATPITPLWFIMTLVGIMVGSAIPEAWALDFIVPIMFLAMVSPMLKSLAHVAAAAVSVSVALALVGLPSGTGLLVAAAAAMVTGALVETWMERRKP